jgi:hypothetical protein
MATATDIIRMPTATLTTTTTTVIREQLFMLGRATIGIITGTIRGVITPIGIIARIDIIEANDSLFAY